MGVAGTNIVEPTGVGGAGGVGKDEVESCRGIVLVKDIDLSLDLGVADGESLAGEWCKPKRALTGRCLGRGWYQP